MSNAPRAHHSDDARPDEGAPTDAVTDEVREDAAEAESGQELDTPQGPDSSGGPGDLPDEPALSHP